MKIRTILMRFLAKIIQALRHHLKIQNHRAQMKNHTGARNRNPQTTKLVWHQNDILTLLERKNDSFNKIMLQIW